MPSIVRLLAAAAAGIAVLWLLAGGAGAQPGTPAYPMTQTAETATSTPTPATRSAAQVVPANATAVAGGRGRVANVRPNGLTVLWTTDAGVVGQVNYGTSASLGSTAVDGRGQAFSGRTHYVEVLGLAPNTVYFFDIVSGGQVDNNGGQHYQIKTGPEITGSPPSGNAVAGQVLNPGGVAPAGGALVWAQVRDGNGQGTGGASQLLAALAGTDGRFNLLLQPRTPDLTAYFVYSNEGDAVEVSARAEQGAVDLSINTAVTQGGTQPSDVRLVLTATPATGAPSPTPTPTSAPAGATAAPTNTPAPTVRPGAPAPAPSATATPAPSAAPVQLPPLREVLLQVGPYPAPGAPDVVGTPAPAPAPAAPAYPAPGAVPPSGQPTPPPAAPLATAKPAAPPVPAPTAVAPGGVVVPAAPGGPAPTPPAKPAPAGAVPPAGAPGGAVSGGAVPAAPPATAPSALPQTGPAGVKGPGAGAFGTGQPAAGPRDSFAQSASPAGTGVAPGGPLATLATLPPLISALFYGGILVIALGAGLAIWSILNGTGWRPR
ncbi:MAG TPA: fibronectin type III domain-containing protein [Chloroflexota bacterium]|nr:fibronectin type III domain-containing protein [Chloroflexota bacterium]